MELNRYGFVTAASVENSKKVKLIQREYESERVTLIKAKNNQTVRVGEVAVIGNKEWLRVSATKFDGTFWIAIEGS